MTPRTPDSRPAAGLAFKIATAKPLEFLQKSHSLPSVTEFGSLRTGCDGINDMQEAGPGRRERIDAVLRKAAGK